MRENVGSGSEGDACSDPGCVLNGPMFLGAVPDLAAAMFVLLYVRPYGRSLVLA